MSTKQLLTEAMSMKNYHTEVMSMNKKNILTELFIVYG